MTQVEEDEDYAGIVNLFDLFGGVMLFAFGALIAFDSRSQLAGLVLCSIGGLLILSDYSLRLRSIPLFQNGLRTIAALFLTATVVAALLPVKPR